MAYGACDSPKARMASRITYVIGQDGKIVQAHAKVSPKTHPSELLETLET
jgi:peroxiredoxin